MSPSGNTSRAASWSIGLHVLRLRRNALFEAALVLLLLVVPVKLPLS
jgi:hypothetical protein